uniref:Coiled-coil domain-containing protein 97 n=1 Tax=Rhizophora mucronata TaxID=61149 RepID=A0A2P2K689_RHIMU
MSQTTVLPASPFPERSDPETSPQTHDANMALSPSWHLPRSTSHH